MLRATRSKTKVGRGARDDDDDAGAAAASCPICMESLLKDPARAGARRLRSAWVAEKAWLDCGHSFCQPCLGTYISTSINDGKTADGQGLLCPVDGCAVPINETVMRQLVSPQDWSKHVRLAKEHKVAANPTLRFCPKPNCKGVARLNPAASAAAGPAALARSSGGKTAYVPAHCGTCGHDFCAVCGCDVHPRTSCDNAADAAYFRWKDKKRNVKPCPSCGFHVEKRGGCRHMYCTRCKASWCWNCLAVYHRHVMYGSCRCWPGGFAQVPMNERTWAMFFEEVVGYTFLALAMLAAGSLLGRLLAWVLARAAA